MEQKLIVMTAELGDFATNCYIVANTETNKAVVIDPADEAKVILEMLRGRGYTLDAVLLTHGHMDHIGALRELREKTGRDIKVFASEPEQEVLSKAQYNLTSMFGTAYTEKADVLLREQKQECEILGCKMVFYLTPGHTKGSCCYYFPNQAWLFSGDTLFAGSIGRTDFPTGSLRAILNSLNQTLMQLPDDTIVFPGHGPSTTIGEERRYNPYVQR